MNTITERRTFHPETDLECVARNLASIASLMLGLKRQAMALELDETALATIQKAGALADLTLDELREPGVLGTPEVWLSDRLDPA